ncbi:GGDEF domain-containing protein, partial [Cuspidothrix issatschenkoi]
QKFAEIDIIRSNGILGRAEITVANTEWLEQQVSIVSMRDVSERNQIEKKLRIALNKQKVLSQKLKKIANTDILTGIANRRHILSVLKKEFQRSQRYHHKFSVLIIDIDHFKALNDTYEHPIGDLVLQEISQFLVNYLRNVDAVGRLGGEEFIAILPATELQRAIELAERLCEQLRNLEIDITHKIVKITVSIGVTSYQVNDLNDSAILNRAEDALYQAKAGGRDRVVAISV